MINFNFNLKNKTKSRTPIILIIRKDYGKVSISTSISIDPKYWDSKKQRVKPQHTDCLRINQELEKKLVYFVELYNEYYTSKPNEKLFDLRKIQKYKVKESKIYNFFEVFDKYLIYLEEILSIETLKKFRTLKKKVENFSIKKKIEVEFNIINLNFMDEFVNYLLNYESLNNSSINKTLGDLNTFLNWSVDRNYIKMNPIVKLNKLPTIDKEIIFLTEEELRKIEELEVPTNQQNYKDVFLFGCYTGQRFSDYGTFDYNELQGDIWVRVQIKSKGKTIVRVPLQKKAMDILDKYRKNGYPILKSQVLNRMIKKISLNVGLDYNIKLVSYKGNKRNEKLVPKYNLISSHTARKTFITLSLLRGMSVEAIKKISGHTSDKEFRKYLKIIDHWVEDEFNKAWG